MSEVGITITGHDRASNVLKKIGDTGKKTFAGFGNTVKALPEQFGKASTALLLFQNSMGQVGGKAADAANKLTAIVGLIATGGPLGLAIGGLTLAIAGASKAWEVFTMESRNAENAQKSIERVFDITVARIRDMDLATKNLSDQLRFFGQTTMQINIQKQEEMVLANERGLSGIQANIDATIRQARATNDLSDEYLTHINNLRTIEAQSKASLEKRRRELELLKQLRDKQDEVTESQDKAREKAKALAEARNKAAEAARKEAEAIRSLNERLRAEAQLYFERLKMAEGMGHRAVEGTRRQLEIEAEVFEKRARLWDGLLAKQREAAQEQAAMYTSLAEQALSTTVEMAENAVRIMGDTTTSMAEKAKSFGQSMYSVAKSIAMQLLIAYLQDLITKKLLKKSEAVSSITANAGIAASGAAAAVASIPVVGPALAPAAAAETFATTIAYVGPAVAAMDTGGILSGYGPIDSALARLTPGKERVLSERQTAAFEKMVAALENGNGMGSTVVISPNYSLVSAPDSKLQRRQLVLDLATDIEEAARDGQLKLAMVGS